MKVGKYGDQCSLIYFRSAMAAACKERVRKNKIYFFTIGHICRMLGSRDCSRVALTSSIGASERDASRMSERSRI